MERSTGSAATSCRRPSGFHTAGGVLGGGIVLHSTSSYSKLQTLTYVLHTFHTHPSRASGEMCCPRRANFGVCLQDSYHANANCRVCLRHIHHYNAIHRVCLRDIHNYNANYAVCIGNISTTTTLTTGYVSGIYSPLSRQLKGASPGHSPHERQLRGTPPGYVYNVQL